MKAKLYLISLLTINSCLATEQIEEIKLLREEISETKELLKIIVTAFAQEHQQQQVMIRRQLEAQRIWQQTPWYEKVWSYTKSATEIFMFRYLLPSMISQLASQVAGEANQCILRSVDKLTGDLCEQYLGKECAFRPGERLMLTPEGRRIANFKRQTKTDPMLAQLWKEIDPYEQQISFSQFIDQERKRALLVKAQHENRLTLDQIRQLDYQSLVAAFTQQAKQELKEKQQISK